MKKMVDVVKLVETLNEQFDERLSGVIVNFEVKGKRLVVNINRRDCTINLDNMVVESSGTFLG